MNKETKFVIKYVFTPICLALVLGVMLQYFFNLSQSEGIQRTGTLLISTAIYMEYRILKDTFNPEYKNIIEVVVFVCLLVGTLLSGYGDLTFKD